LTGRAKQWYRPRDFRRFKTEAKQAALKVRESDYYTHFLQVYESCDRPHFCFDDHANIANVETRGLENAIFPMLLADRKAVIQAVLRAQKKVTADMTLSRRTKVLAAISVFLSRHARCMARAVAIGDESIAEEIQRE
jgi:hypothetical protein